MEEKIKIHNSFIYWSYKYLYFGMILLLDSILLIEFIKTKSLGSLIGFSIFLLTSLFIFFLFQFKFNRLYLTNDILILKGFFFGTQKFNNKSVEFHIKKELFSIGLIRLVMTVKETGKSFVIITNDSNLKPLKSIFKVGRKR
jgi:hypothetical protein